MSTTVEVQGCLTAIVTQMTLTAGEVATVAHGLGASPNFVIPMLAAGGANTSMQGALAVVSWDATNVVFKNLGAQTIGGRAFAMRTHSMTK